ncbi:hypothetical protein OKW21_001641 [Catalinimonas alkaloidigena]|uniref:RagB/SusD family nutrient uptake outer membrane protein n=1 Tax=Catalinimonas alkaloidigena TaxID=1075417 RepID=UPI002407267C|nr:RagB/SusD family nutrient uptake outer membrane protein [Catalinimonas alkaloidigena]MDF9796378.1 hypothetical protein [Catalinimonas alkaloidigena]
MKTSNIYIYRFTIILSLSIVFSACEDFLSTVPSDQYTSDNFWESEEQAQAALTGIYEVLRGYPANQIFYSAQITPNAVRFDNPGGWRDLARGLAQTTNPLFESAWTSNYRGVGRANTLLDNIEKIEAEPDVINKIIAEAKFLRAFYYADLVNKFGAVPLITSAPDLVEQGELPRNSKADVVTQILNDLDEAADVLPLTDEPGRATKGAALSLKARVLLYEQRWEEAADAAQAVMDLDVYSLFPDYRELFMLENEGNEEVIWDIQYFMPRFGHGYDNAVTLHSNVAPTKELVDAYYMIDGLSIAESSSYDPENPYENRDPRLYQTIRLVGAMYNGKINTDSDLDQTGFGVKKFTTYSDSTTITEVSGGRSEINPIVIRFAEVLLTYAEAQNEAVGPDESVYEAINRIRSRPSVNMPALEPGLSKDEMREEIRHERRIELAFEGKYYADIKRWGTAEELMNVDVHDYQGNVYTTRTFNPARDYLWAIPSNQIDLNPNLEQNPNW